MATSRISSDHNIPANEESVHIGKLRHKPYNIKNKSLFDQPSDVPGVTVIRPMNEMFLNAVYYQNYITIKKFSQYYADAAA